jgi:hypothetical protein
MTNYNIGRITELDFDTIKQNLIDHFKSQQEFSDYNFEGSGLTALINNLAYVAHYLGFYANMGFAEKFLDSAVTRAAVVSAAKDLGYNTSSITSAFALVNVNVNNIAGLPTTVTLPKYSKFTASSTDSENPQTFTFVNTEAYTATKIGNNYYFNDVEIHEGVSLSYNFVVGSETSFIYEIPNSDVDINTISVRVQNSLSDMTTTIFTEYNTLVNIDGESNIFFVEENYKGKYQLQFGDGILGKKLSVGNVITVDYLVTNGVSANGLKNFVLDQSIFGSGTSITTLSPTNLNGASGGSDRQSIASIKFTAPKSYIAQNRLVTTNDFYAEISGISSIESVSVWGGEDNVPPSYGRVFISAKPVGGLYLSDTLKNDILLNRLKPKKVSIITPVFVDPDYIYTNLHVTAKYDKNINNLGIGDMEQVVRTAISNFQTSELGKFNNDFLYEPFLNYIKSSSAAITSTYAVLKLQKRFSPNFNVNSNYDINFNTPLQQNRLESTRFYVYISGALRLVSLSDYTTDTSINPASIGTLRLIDSSSGIVYNDNVGTIDYMSGLVAVDPMIINSLPNGIGDIRVTASVQENTFDIATYRNNIILIDDSHIDTTVNLKNGVFIDIIPT